VHSSSGEDGSTLDITSATVAGFTVEVEKHRYVVTVDTTSGGAPADRRPAGFNVAGLTTDGLTQFVSPAGDVVRSTTAKQTNGSAIHFAKVDATMTGTPNPGETWRLTINAMPTSMWSQSGDSAELVAAGSRARSMPSYQPVLDCSLSPARAPCCA